MSQTPLRKVWGIAPYNVKKPIWDDVWRFDYANNHISIGWAYVGDVTALDADQLKERVKEKIIDLQPNETAQPGMIARQFRLFYREIKAGHIILARRGLMQIEGLGVVSEDPPYFDKTVAKESNIPDFEHPNFRPVRWIRAFKPIKYSKAVFQQHTIQPFNNPEILNTIENYFKLEISDSDESLRNSAIDDIPAGTSVPAKIPTSGFRYQRKDEVRRFVLNRAKGACEYCHELGFLLPDGNHYLETHHILALAAQGPDEVANVIALCPSDHREAHYGANKDAMNNEMIQIVKRR